MSTSHATPSSVQNSLQALGLCAIEPISITPLRLVEVLSTMRLQDWPESLLELGRLGVPRAVQGLLLELASDTITEKELVRGFLIHLTSLRTDQVRNPWRVWIMKNRLITRLEKHPMTIEEKLVLLSLNSLCRQELSSWADWAGDWCLDRWSDTRV